MRIDWTWLLIGLALGWFVIPMLLGKAASKQQG